MSAEETIEKIVDIEKRLAAEGRFIEGGFASLCGVALRADPSPEKMDEFRLLFFCGASHLFGLISGMIDKDKLNGKNADPVLVCIQRELEAFTATLEQELLGRNGIQ